MPNHVFIWLFIFFIYLVSYLVSYLVIMSMRVVNLLYIFISQFLLSHVQKILEMTLPRAVFILGVLKYSVTTSNFIMIV